MVFHANYLDFMERARIEWLRNQGFEPQELARRFQVVFIVRQLEIAYMKPAVLDDLVTVTAAVQKLGRAQVTLVQEVLRGNEALVRASVNLACVATGSLKPMPVPDKCWRRLPMKRCYRWRRPLDAGSLAGAATAFNSLGKHT